MVSFNYLIRTCTSMSRTHLVLFFVSFVLVGCGMSSEEKQELAAVTCSIMVETQTTDATIRVEKINDARKQKRRHARQHRQHA